MSFLKSEKLSGNLKSIKWILLWCLSFTFAMTCAKFLSKDVGDVVLLFLRSLFGLILVVPFALKEGVSALKTKRLPLHVLRVLFSCIAIACTYYAYRNLPIAFATSIGFSAPLFTTVLAMIFLGDRVRPNKWLAIIVGYVGVLLMLRPAEFFMDSGIIVALIANLAAGCALVTIKKLTKTESDTTIMLYTALGTVLISGIATLFSWKSPALQDLLILCGVGAFGTFSQYCYVAALRNGDPSFVSPFQYTRLIIALPVGYFVFFEAPSIWEFIGSAVIIASTYYIAQSEMVVAKQVEEADKDEQAA